MKNLIVQLFGIMFPILVYQMLWDKPGQTVKVTKYIKFLLFFAGGISLLICMTFPVSLGNHYYYDMRDIPLLICTLYGGMDIGIALSVLMFGYRFFLTGAALYPTLISHVIILPFAFHQILKFRRYSLPKRVKGMAMLSFLLGVTIMAASLVLFQMESSQLGYESLLLFFPTFIILNTAGVSITTFLIEKINENRSIAYELKESDKLRVVSQLAAAIAHEVRNPLTVVRGFIQLMATDKLELEKRQHYAKVMISELDRAQGIITDYLNYAKPQSQLADMESVDIQSQILQAVNVMAPYALSQAVNLEPRLHEKLFVRAERSKLSQVWVNLIKNAIEAMPDGGVIQILAEHQCDHIQIDVMDQGLGMTPEQLKQLGSPFYTTKEKGTGLGLMVCYRIIEELGGRIQVKSKVGEGSRFSIMIPAECHGPYINQTASKVASLKMIR